MTSPRWISILGSTGSIGRSALDVIVGSGGRFAVAGLAAGRNIELLAEQIKKFRPLAAAVMSEELAAQLKGIIGKGCKTVVLFGKAGYKEIASLPKAHLVLSAMVGAAGLIPTMAAIEAGKDVALANKESLVTAGPLVMQKASEHKVHIIPVDSEHSAIFQCLQGNPKDSVKRLILTASGGPFWTKSSTELKDVTPEEAVAHPNWSMGAKISVDSSTLMNKGLEVIEASWLFGMSADSIDVVIHPQSIVHSMVEFIDGSVLAQLGVPDMRGPIAYAFSWPDRIPTSVPGLDIVKSSPLTFEKPDMERFPCLKYAYDALRKGGTIPAALNAANEVAVAAFLEGRIGYRQISDVISSVLEDFPRDEIDSLDAVMQADALARLRAENVVEKIA